MPPACRSCPTGVYRGNCAGCNAGRRSNRWSAGSKCACKHPAVLPFKSLHNTRICIPCRDLFSTVASTPEETPASTPTPPASTPASTPALTGASFVSPTKHARSVFRTPSPTKFPQRDTETRSGKHYISIPAAHPTTPLRSTVGHWQHTITEWCDCGKARGEYCKAHCDQCEKVDRPTCTGKLLIRNAHPEFEGPVATVRVECGECHHRFVFVSSEQHQKMDLRHLGASDRTTGHQQEIVVDVIAARVGNPKLSWTPYGPLLTPMDPLWTSMDPMDLYGPLWTPYGPLLTPMDPLWTSIDPYGPHCTL